ncbi:MULTISPECIES: restriction endonuclease subunit S [Klebsiella pneumoniae complex]|uniref:restriction endonuclease subunit S n=1 Tax=Klebsiella pneumoniae complex TaxID=3390273 RepID=UPI0007CD11AF|nr:restriction endonuclease subunit S [Klebsiella pneumoniae]MCE0030434.1 restriction endonuclease subunit S [Klebsiella pneumoniae]MCM2174558.1 restriction endonuclease subunit S [Klebsiella pneumoniae]MCX3427412.1 restriction endonuclease subunit S [Klebsiella pneumoniae]MDT0589609.1 restriction endonuclease subunit S [Klebsiella pneumoniae]SAX77158.1 type I restriction-modification system subunit S [Klebsiella pneumoniae]
MAFNYEINQLELMQARIKNVPHGWQFTYVGKAFSIRNNLRKPISEEERSMSPGNYPYYGPTKIQGYIGTYEQDGSYALIGEDGDHFLKFEKHSMTQLVDGKCTVNNHAHIIEGTKEASREWFYYYFMHRDIFSFLSRQGAGRYKLNKESLEKMPLLLPPIAEQKKIAQILSTWDKAISVTEKLLTNSQQQKKALMQQLLSGKKRLLDENGVMFSGEWEVVRLKQLIHEEKKRNRDNHIQRVLSVTNHSGFVLPEEQFSKRVASEDVSTYKIVKKNQYGYNPSRLNVGSFARLDNYDEGVLSPMYVVFSINHERLNSDYFLNWMSSNEAKQRIAGSTQGSVRDSVGFDALCSFSFSLPTLMEQQKIAAVLSAADAEMSMLEKKLACLKEEKKALMQQLLTGKRRVKVESEETVSA